MRIHAKLGRKKRATKKPEVLKFEKEKIPRKTLKYLEDRVAEVSEDPSDIEIGPCYDSDRDECIFTNKNSNQSDKNIDEFLEIMPHLDVDRAILFLSEFPFPEAIRVAQKLCASTLLPHQLAKRKLRMKEISRVKNSSAKRSSFITRSSSAGQLQATSNNVTLNENRKRKINQISSPEEPKTPEVESIITETTRCRETSESQEIEEPKTKKKCGRPRKNQCPETGKMKTEKLEATRETQKTRFPKREIQTRIKLENSTGKAPKKLKIELEKREIEPKKDGKLPEKLSKFRRKSSMEELAENAQADLAKLLEF